MSAQAQATFDNLQLARSGGVREADVALAALPRLEAELAEREGSVHYRIEGFTEAGRPALRLTVAGILPLRCQRCMQPFPWPLAGESRVLVARDEAELERWESRCEGDHALLDAVLAEPRVDVLQFVEDEILLSLPVSPRHPEGCAGSASADKPVSVKE